jgi:hypothetical protein
VPNSGRAVGRPWTDSFPIIPNSQSELAFIIVQLNFDPVCLSVLEGITQRLSCDPVGFIPQDGVEVARRSCHVNLKYRRADALIASKLSAQCTQSFSETILCGCGRAQALDGIAPFYNRLSSLVNGTVKSLL